MADAGRKTITAHILDTTTGRAVVGMKVTLFKLESGGWIQISENKSDISGRCGNMIQEKDFIPGCYKIYFDVMQHFRSSNVQSFYPFVEIVFDVTTSQEHYHIPLLLNPYGYTTYRGS